MNDEFENELKRALRPVEPDAGFADRVTAHIRDSAGRGDRIRPTVRLRFRWLPVALAASMALGIVTYEWHAHRVREGIEARRQLIEALRVTQEKLDFVYQTVKQEAHSNDDSGV